jgi:hypothetical protein
VSRSNPDHLPQYKPPPYMKGRGRIKSLFLGIVPDPPIGVLHESARQRDVGVNVGRCPPKAWR